jgi:hypothetical protein
MTNTENALNHYFADFTDGLMHDALDHEAETAPDVEPDFAPDPDFAGMSIPEIHDILDEQEREARWHA